MLLNSIKYGVLIVNDNADVRSNRVRSVQGRTIIIHL